MNELYTQYKEKMQRIADLRYASAVLQWDQETYIPPRSGQFRGQQIATLSEIAHQMFTSEELGSILNDLKNEEANDEDSKKNVELSKEDYDRNKKYSSEFVRTLTEQTNRCFYAWLEARKENSFAVFLPELSKLIGLKKQEADLLGYEGHPYNALLDEFEKGATVNMLDKVFGDLLPSLKKILADIQSRPQVDDSFLRQHYPKQKQWDWGMYIVKELHFQLDAGRQDISEHPFTTSFSPTDVRITTRIDEQDFGNMTWSCIHEAGHALYEQGLPESQYGLPLGEAASLGIHESQSRLWENNVGRSLAFWKYYYPALRNYFPEQLKELSLEDFYKGINKVQPSLIRTEADEISYHFHVMIRYELEKNLLTNELKPADIPGFWNEHYKKYLGVDVPDDKRGCLQDVHWSHGSFGYFPTYSLGSMYAAQFFSFIQKEFPQTNTEITPAETRKILDWLRQHIHAFGRKYTSEQLCEKITGTKLDSSYFVKYLLHKYRTIYNL
jgi:carboxypeptidase Taq